MNRYRLVIVLMFLSCFGQAQDTTATAETEPRSGRRYKIKDKEFSVRNLNKEVVYNGSTIRVKLSFAPPSKKMRKNMTIIETIPEGCTAVVTHYAGAAFVVQENRITFRYKNKKWKGLFIVYNIHVNNLDKGIYKISGTATYGRAGYFAVIREMARIPIPKSKKKTKITMKESYFTVKKGVKLIKVWDPKDE